MSELEKVKAQINRIREGLGQIVASLDEIDEAWEQSGQIVSQKTDLENLALEALKKTQPMRTKSGLWMWSREAPELKKVLQENKGRLELTLDNQLYTLRLGNSQEEKDAFLSFWPKQGK